MIRIKPITNFRYFAKTTPNINWNALLPKMKVNNQDTILVGAPKFFTDLVFDKDLREFTATNDDLAFRLVTMMNNILVVMGCCDEKHPCWIPVNF